MVWLGEGLGSIPKRTHDRMLRWKLMHGPGRVSAVFCGAHGAAGFNTVRWRTRRGACMT